MSKAATREDIDEILGTLQAFMQQVSDQFKTVNRKLEKQDDKYDRFYKGLRYIRIN